MSESITLIFPAYNEAARIESTVAAAVGYFENHALDYQIIVAADGNDGTREAVQRMGVANARLSAIGSTERRGKGHGIRQAVKLATGRIIGFADADDKTPISELDKFLPHLRDGADVVIGTRTGPGSVIERAQPLYRRLGSRGFGLIMHLVVGLWDIPDTQCGFKFFQAVVAKDLFSRQRIDGYMYDVEILHLAHRSGYHITQVPVRWRDDGDSRLGLLGGNIQNVADVFRIRFNHDAAGRDDGSKDAG